MDTVTALHMLPFEGFVDQKKNLGWPWKPTGSQCWDPWISCSWQHDLFNTPSEQKCIQNIILARQVLFCLPKGRVQPVIWTQMILNEKTELNKRCSQQLEHVLWWNGRDSHGSTEKPEKVQDTAPLKVDSEQEFKYSDSQWRKLFFSTDSTGSLGGNKPWTSAPTES